MSYELICQNRARLTVDATRGNLISKYLMKIFRMTIFPMRIFLMKIFRMKTTFQGWWSCKCSRQSGTSTTSPNTTTHPHGTTQQHWAIQQRPLQQWVTTQHTPQHLNRVNHHHQQQQQQRLEQLDQLGGELHPTWHSETEEEVFLNKSSELSSVDLLVSEFLS